MEKKVNIKEKRGFNFETSLYISWFPKQNLKKIELKTTWKKVQEMLLMRLYLLKLAKYLHRLLKEIWCLILSDYLDVARGGVPPAYRTLSSTSYLKKKKLKFILIISFTSYWYYTCCCRLDDSLAGFQIVENKALLPHLPFLSHWFDCYLHSFYPIWSLQQKGLFSSGRLKLVWWQSDRNLSCFHAGILEGTRFPWGLCGLPHHWGRSASQKW